MIFALLSVSWTLNVEEVIKNDVCLKSSMETLAPKVLKAVTEENYQEIATSYVEIKAAFDSCHVQDNLPANLSEDPLKDTGVAFLLASNCFKDVGALMLILDSAVVDPSNIEQDVIVAIILGIMGTQGRKDCGQFINYIRNL